MGILWEHPLFEVPVIYGDNVRFYRSICREAAESAFVHYVTSRGVDLRRFTKWREREELK